MGYPKKKEWPADMGQEMTEQEAIIWNCCHRKFTAEIKKRAAVEEIERVIDEYLDNQSNADMNWRHCLATAIHAHLVGDLEGEK